MARTKQTAKKSTFGSAARGSLNTVLGPVSTKTKPAPPARILKRATTGPKTYAPVGISPLLQGPRTIDIGRVQGTMCCLCGTGGCVLEGCQIDNCSNAVCIENDQNHPCAPSVAEGAWLCPTHDGSADTTIQYDGNRRIDIQTIELVSFSEWEILLSATKLTFTPYNHTQILFTNHSFADGDTLRAAANSVYQRWRLGANRWLLILTHTNKDGDLWFEINDAGQAWACTLDEFIDTVFANQVNHIINLVLFVCGSLVHSTKSNTRKKMQEETSRVVNALQRPNIGNILLFTRHELRPNEIAGDVLAVIEQHEMCGVPLAEAVRQRGDLSSPVWVLENGEGTYIHGKQLPCAEHLRAFKGSGRCTMIERGVDGKYVVEVKECKAPRLL